MIEVTDEMVQLALDIFLATPTDTIAQIDAGAAKALAAVFELVEQGYDFNPIRCRARYPGLGVGHCALAKGHVGDHSGSAAAVPVAWAAP